MLSFSGFSQEAKKIVIKVNMEEVSFKDQDLSLSIDGESIRKDSLQLPENDKKYIELQVVYKKRSYNLSLESKYLKDCDLIEVRISRRFLKRNDSFSVGICSVVQGY
jgi:hypothetical protein